MIKNKSSQILSDVLYCEVHVHLGVSFYTEHPNTNNLQQCWNEGNKLGPHKTRKKMQRGKTGEWRI